MKTLCFSLVLAASTMEMFGQAGRTRPSGSDRPTGPAIQETPYAVVERGAHHRVWARVSLETNDLGHVLARTNSYVELATGMHYLQNGRWVESKEAIEAFPGGAVARQGPHRVTFANNLATAGAIDMETPDGKRMRGHILGLSYYDTASGKSVMIAEVKECQGQIVDSNQVLYANAFTDFQADVRYRYTRGGFEQDVILRERPPAPEEYGLDSRTTRLQVLTEFLNPPELQRERRTLKRRDGSEAEDEDLNFGVMRMGHGKAFSLGRKKSLQDIPVAKQWLKLEGREILVEEVNVPELEEEWRTLAEPKSASLKPIRDSVRNVISTPRLVPPSPPSAKASDKPMQLAQVASPDRGLVLDYVTVINQTGYTFQGDTTYYVSGPVALSGTITFEGGAVIKYNTNSSLTINAPFTWNWLATDYRPVVFTAKADNSVGESFGTGNPTNYYGNPVLQFNNGGATLNHFRIAYAQQAVSLNTSGVTFKNGQLVNCQNGILVGNSGIALRNVLVASVFNVFNNLVYANVSAENCTFVGVTPGPPSYVPSFLALPGGDPQLMSLNFVNCIFNNFASYSPANASAVHGDNNGFYNNGGGTFGTTTFTATANPFQVKGAGNYYLTNLANGTGFRNKGTTAIDATLLAELPRKTTFPPTNPPVATPQLGGTTWNQIVARDNDGLLDLGYHYDPLDYWCSQYVMGGAPHTLASGVSVAFYGASGLTIQGGGGMISDGRADAMNHLVWYPAVQEQPVRIGGVSVSTSPIFNISSIPNTPKSISLKFTDLAMQGLRQLFFDFGVPYNWPALTLRDCWLRGVNLGIGSFYNAGMPMSSATLQNNLLERCTVSLFNGYILYYYGPGQYSVVQNPLFVDLHNNLFWRSSVGLTYMETQDTYKPTWSIQDNLFDNSAVSLGGDGAYLSKVTRSHNGFFNTTPGNLSGTSGDVTLTALNYASVTPGLGPWYIDTATTSPTVVNAGSRTAALAGLFHHTIRTSQLKEGDDPPLPGIVDLGFHYVALAGNGSPIDTDGDGQPDYVEDKNGNGLTGAGETPWAVPPSSISITPPSQTVAAGSAASFTVSASGTAPFTYQWRFNGSPLSDGGGISGSQSATLVLNPVVVTHAGNYSVTVVNSAASVLSGNAQLCVTFLLSLPSGDVSHTKGSGPTLIDPAATHTGTLNGASVLTVQFPAASSSPADRLAIRNQGTGAGQIGVSGQNITYGGVTIGSFPAGGGLNGSALIITLNASATDSALDALMRNLTYELDLAQLCRPAAIRNNLQLSLVNSQSGCSSPIVSKIVNIICPAVDVMIVFDKSGSMDDVPNRLPNAKSAAATFVGLLNLEAALNPDHCGLVTFCASTQLNVALGSGTTEGTLTTEIGKIGLTTPPNIPLCDGTAIGLGLQAGTNGLPLSGRPRVIVILTDGEENQNSDPVPKATRAKLDGYRIITIGVELGQNQTARQTLKDMASDNFNRPQADNKDFYDATDSATLTEIYTQIANSLCADPNQPPSVQFSRTSATYVENGPAIVVDPGLIFTDLEDFTGGTLTISLTANAQPGDALDITSQGQIGVNGTQISFAGNFAGSVSGQSSTTLTVTLNSQFGTAAAAREVLRSVTYRNSASVPATVNRTLQVIANDQDGGCNAGVSQPATIAVNVTRIVNRLVDAGPDQTIWINASCSLAGTPVTAGAGQTLAWSVVGGPGTVNFSAINSGTSSAQFGLPGLYVLRLNLTQGASVYSDDVTIVVRNNKPPTVDAGPDRILNMPSAALTITGTSSDDWTAAAQLSYQWSVINAPGGFSLTPPAGPNLALGANLPAGEYTFRLQVTDGTPTSPPLSATDDVKVWVTDMRGRTWTRDADFEEGRMVNVDYEKISDALTFAPRGTTSRLSFSRQNQGEGDGLGIFLTLDSDTGETLAVHPTGASMPLGYGPRFDEIAALTGQSGDNYLVGYAKFATDLYPPPAAIIRYGTVVGGKRVNASNTPDPTGEFLLPPYKYNTCIDRNGGTGGAPDGRLRVPGDPVITRDNWEVTPISGRFPTVPEQDFMLSQCVDEGIVGFRVLPLKYVVSVQQDSKGDLWVSGINSLDYFQVLQLNPITLNVIGSPIDPGWPVTQWPGPWWGSTLEVQMLVNDRLLVAGLPGTAILNLSTRTVESTVSMPTPNDNLIYDWYNSSPRVTAHPGDGNFWYTAYEFVPELGYSLVHAFHVRPDLVVDPAGGLNPGVDNGFNGSIVLGRDNDLWSGIYGVDSYSYLARFDAQSQTLLGVLPCVMGSARLSADIPGRIWVGGSPFYRIDPKRGPVSSVNGKPIGRIDLLVNEPSSEGGYTHIPNGIMNIGVWTAVHDCQIAAVPWGKVTWTATVDLPTKATIKVEARAASSQLALVNATWQAIANSGDSLGQAGQLVEVRVTFNRGTTGIEPVLQDLTVMPAGSLGQVIPVSGQIAVDDEFNLNRGDGEQIYDVRANDKISGLTIVSINQPRSGSARIVGNQIGYTPSANFYGEDRLVYTVSGPAGLLDRALVKLKVAPEKEAPAGEPIPDSNGSYEDYILTYGPRIFTTDDCVEAPGNRPPNARTDLITVLGRASAAVTTEHSIPVLANDSDPDKGDHVFLVDDFPRKTGFGRVRKVGDVLMYLPSVLAYGTDTFTYTVQDEHGAQSTGTVIVRVAPATPPTVVISSPTAGIISDPASITVTAAVTAGQVDTSQLFNDFFGGLSIGHLFGNQTGPLPAFVNPQVVKVEFFAGAKKLGETYAPQTGNQWSVAWPEAPSGSFSISVVATDEIGSIGVSDPVKITVFRSGPPNLPPVAELTKFVDTDADPVPGSTEQMFERSVVHSGRPTIMGRITDGDTVGSTALSYQILLYRADGTYLANVTPGASGGYASVPRPGIDGFPDGDVIGTLDLTAYANGGYDLELWVFDGIDETISERFSFILRSQLKLGQFTFQQEDVTEGTPGLPLTIVRSYDSSKPWDGDFGHGWDFAVNDLDVEMNEQRIGAIDAFTDEPLSLRVGGGWDVTLTLPDGRRTTFLYQIAPALGGIPFSGRMIWEAEPGVTATLSTLNPQTSGAALGDNQIFSLPGNPPIIYWQDGGPACPIENFDIPKLVLTLDDQTKYFIDRDELGEFDVEVEPGKFISTRTYGKPHVSRIERPNGEQLVITPEGVDHYLGGLKTRSLTFERNTDNHIIAVRDEQNQSPATAPLVRYDYNGLGNLVRVERLVDRQNETYETTTYKYEKPSAPYYITSVVDPRGIEIARTTYYADGKIQSITDAKGRVTSFSHLTSGFEGDGVYGTPVAREVVTFSAGAGLPTQVTVHEADERGNVMFSKDATGFRTWRKFEGRTDLATDDPAYSVSLMKEERFQVNESGTTRTYLRNWDFTGTGSTAQKLAPTTITDTHLEGQTSDLRVTRYEYNALGQAIKVFDPKNSSGNTVYQETKYDEILTSPTYTQVIGQYFHGTDPAPANPVTGQQLSSSVYITGIADPLRGNLWYSLDARNTATVYEYYTANGTDGRVGDLKSVTVRSPGYTGAPLSKTVCTYDFNGQRLTEERVKFQRDGSGNVIESGGVPAETGRLITRYQYDAKGRVTKTTDPSLATAETAYDSLGRAAVSIDRYAATTKHYYDRMGNSSGTDYPDGTVVYQATYYEDGGSGVGLLRCNVVQDRHSASQTGPVTGTRTVQNATGRTIRSEKLKNLVIKVTVNGDVCDTDYDASQPCLVLTRTRTEYLADGRVYRTIAENDLSTANDDAVTSYTYSADGLQKITYLPDAVDGTDTMHTRMIQTSDLNGNSVTNQTKSFRNNNSTPETQRPVTAYVYDQLNRLKDTRSFTDETDTSAGVLQESSKYGWSGHAWLQVDADSHAKALIYDASGQLVWAVTDVEPTATYPTTLPTTASGWQTWAKGTRGVSDSTATQYQYNELGQQTAQIDAKNHTTLFFYDALGRRTERYLPMHTAPAPYVERWYYDWDFAHSETEENQPWADGKRANVVRHVDFKNQQMFLTYDAMGRLDQKRSDSTIAIVDYDYADTGMRSRMRDNLNTASPRESRYAYDEQNRLRIKSTPEGTLTYDYDLANNLKLISTKTSYSFPSGPPYDFAAINASANSSFNPSGASMAYLYDTRRRLSKVNPDVAPGASADAIYNYDAVGNQTKMTYRNEVVTDYAYDARNHLRRMRSVVGANLRANFDYDEAGQNATPNTTTFTWGSRRLSNSGRRNRLVEVVNGATSVGRQIDYDYDNLNRLTREALGGASPNVGTITYDSAAGYSDPAGYDPVGNRNQRIINLTPPVGTPYSFPNGTINYAAYDANDRLGTIQSTKVGASFDANGNTIQLDLNADGTPDVATADVYDLDDRLITATRAGGTINLVYDGDGTRVKKTVGSTVTYYLVDEKNLTGYAQVLEERSALTGAPSVTYVYGLDLISQTRGSATAYYGYDGLGTVRYLTDGTSGSPTYNQITDTYIYDAFGIQIGGSGSTINWYRYTGEQYDTDLQMYYLRARYYRPELGRFWTMDTYEGDIKDVLSLHKYLYCGDNPINYIDPTGHFLTLIELLIVNGALIPPMRAKDAQRVSLQARLARLGLLAIGAIGSAVLTQAFLERPLTNPELIKCANEVSTLVSNNKQKIHEYCKQHNIQRYKGANDVPNFQKVRQSAGYSYHLFGTMMLTINVTEAKTLVSNQWLEEERPVGQAIIPLLAHEYGHVLYGQLFITPTNESNATDFQSWFVKEFYGLDVGGAFD